MAFKSFYLYFLFLFNEFHIFITRTCISYPFSPCQKPNKNMKNLKIPSLPDGALEIFGFPAHTTAEISCVVVSRKWTQLKDGIWCFKQSDIEHERIFFWQIRTWEKMEEGKRRKEEVDEEMPDLALWIWLWYCVNLVELWPKWAHMKEFS